MNTQMTFPEILSVLPDRTGETGAECELILPDYCPNVLRILQTTAIPTLNSVTQSADRLTLEGSVEYQILYLPEDGSGIKSVCQQTTFSYSMDLKSDDAEADVTVTPKNCNARALNSRKIYARCTLLIRAKLHKNQVFPAPVSAPDLETKLCRTRAAKILCAAQKPLRISDEFELDAGKRATTVLQSNLTFLETEQKPLTEKLIVKADMIVSLLCAATDGTVFPIQKTIPVSQILDLPEIQPDALCKTEFFLTASTFLPRDEGGEGNQTISYDVEIEVKVTAYGETAVEWTEDAYSVKKESECTTQTVATEVFLPVEESGAIRETAEIGTCSGLLWVDVQPEWKRTEYREETDRFVCEGVWECKFLLTDPDGTPCSAVRELPFSLELPAKECSAPIRNDTDLVLTDLTWTLTDASHAEIRGTYHWNGLIFCRKTGQTVTEITEKTDRPRNRNTVLLYYAGKGESAWEIAKEHACPYTELLRANQLEEDILKEDQMLVIIAG